VAQGRGRSRVTFEFRHVVVSARHRHVSPPFCGNAAGGAAAPTTCVHNEPSWSTAGTRAASAIGVKESAGGIAGRMERAYRSVGYFLLALVPIFIAGFWVPYLAQIPHFDATITPAVHVHAILLFTWLALLIVQPLLVRYRAPAMHRRIGKISYVLMALIVPFSVAMLFKEYGENLSAGATSTVARNAELISAAQLLVVVVAYVLAIISIRERNVAAHMRYMICIAAFLLPAGLTRTLGYWFNIRQMDGATVSLVAIEVILAALIAYDLRRGLNPRPYVIGLLAYNVTAVAWIALGRPV